MCAHPAKFNFPFVEKLDKGWPRHVQHVRRFLRGEFGVQWGERNGIAPRHLFQNVNEHPYSGGRNLYRCFFRIVEHAKPERLCRFHA